MSEILRKYNVPSASTPGKAPESRPGLSVYEAFQDCFNMLPLATLIEKDGRKVRCSCSRSFAVFSVTSTPSG